MTKKSSIGVIAFAAACIGAGAALALLLPLPAATDIYVARRWGVGVDYVGLVLGFPFSIVAVPMVVAIHPFPVGGDASGALTVASMIVGTVALNWAGLTVVFIGLIRMLRDIRARARMQPSQPLAKRTLKAQR